jgi:hypothetical protein
MDSQSEAAQVKKDNVTKFGNVKNINDVHTTKSRTQVISFFKRTGAF